MSSQKRLYAVVKSGKMGKKREERRDGRKESASPLAPRRSRFGLQRGGGGGGGRDKKGEAGRGEGGGLAGRTPSRGGGWRVQRKRERGGVAFLSTLLRTRRHTDTHTHTHTHTQIHFSVHSCAHSHTKKKDSEEVKKQDMNEQERST